MSGLTALIAAADLRDALGPTTYTAIFDDTNAGPGNESATAVAQIIRRAHALMVSRCPDVLGATLPTGTSATAPDLLFSAELDYAVALSYERHPEYVRKFGERERMQAYARAEKIMDNFQASVQRAPDITTIPKNLGGSCVDTTPRLISDSADGTVNGGDF